MAMDYTHIGLVLSNQGIHDQALEYHEKALAIDKELNDRVGMSKDYRNIGHCTSKPKATMTKH